MLPRLKDRTPAAARLLCWCCAAALSIPARAETNLLEAPRLPPLEQPPSPESIAAAMTRGLDWLVANQNQDGSWGSPRRTKELNIYAPVPGAHHAFGAATTSLCISAILDCGDTREPVLAALARGEDWLMAALPHLRRATPVAIYNVWGHAYGLQALARMHRRLPDDAERRRRIAELMAQQIELLARYETVDGGWGYYDFDLKTQKPGASSTSFVNAAVLVALHEAKEVGVLVPERVVLRAVVATQRQRQADFSYQYGEYMKYRPVAGINRPAGSLGRSQACNLALQLWGDQRITTPVLTTWLDRLISRNGWLEIGRKRPVPHESWFQVAGYFYYFGHYYAAHSLALLPAERRPYYQQHLAALMIDQQEKDGSWLDYPLYDYGHPYATGFALSTLSRCR